MLTVRRNRISRVAIFLPFLLLTSCGAATQPATVSAGALRSAEAHTQAAAATRLSVPATPTPPPATPTPAPTPTPDTRPPLSRTTNILVLGSDRRPDTPNWRTDVLMIVALDLVGQQAAVISLPRDLYLEEIPGHQPNRVNVVDYLGERDEANGGGPKLLTSIIRQRMGIEIHHYLRFDFDSFRAVVDALGGVEIDVHCAYEDKVYIDNAAEAVVLDVQPGHYRMDGNTALAYVRSRRIGGDLDRAQRQQQFVWAVRDEILKENVLPRIPALYAALADSIQTDIGLVTALQLTRFALTLERAAVHGLVLAPPKLLTPGWRQGMSIFVADWSAIAEAVQQVFAQPAFGNERAISCP